MANRREGAGSSVDNLDSKPGNHTLPDGASYYEGFKPAKGDVYNMNRDRRGYFVIINNKDFDSSTGMSERSGTNVDADALVKTFSSIGFSVYRKDNVTVNGMLSIVKKFAAEDHSNVDCFGLAVLSHGDEGVIYGTDDLIQIDILLSPIKKCKSLAGKPKLFFIQACRGAKLDDGMFVEADGGERVVKIPIEADCLYAFSTVPGYYSWRNSMKGSWFIQALVKVFAQEGHATDLLHLMTRVNNKVAYDFESNSSSMAMTHKKQVPYIASTLTKDVYFLPKYK